MPSPVALSLPKDMEYQGDTSEVKMLSQRNDRSDQFRKELFTGWTSGISTIEQRISIFSHIRDIPYAIVPEWRDSEDVERKMVTANRGWCGPKHHLLAWMFQYLGIEIRFTFIPFRWQDQNVRYPERLTELLPYIPTSTHLCCTALLNGTWQLLDATWDPPLRKAGFLVNKPWDGMSETTPAVVRFQPKNEDATLYDVASREKRVEFVGLLNTWLEEIRTETNQSEL